MGMTLNSLPDWLQQLYQNNNVRPVQPLQQGPAESTGGGLPLMAPTMVGHPIGLRDRERAILAQYGNY